MVYDNHLRNTLNLAEYVPYTNKKSVFSSSCKMIMIYIDLVYYKKIFIVMYLIGKWSRQP